MAFSHVCVRCLPRQAAHDLMALIFGPRQVCARCLPRFGLPLPRFFRGASPPMAAAAAAAPWTRRNCFLKASMGFPAYFTLLHPLTVLLVGFSLRMLLMLHADGVANSSPVSSSHTWSSGVVAV